MPLIRTNNLELQINARKDDTVRIANFLASGPGVTFAAKQALLRGSIPATKLAKFNLTPEEKLQAGKEALAGAATAAAHIATMLAQVPVNGTGTHFLYNELARLVAEPGQLYYAGTGNAANQALYRGVINISVNSSKMKGKKSWDDRGFGGAGEPDDIGLLGILEESDAKDKALQDTLPITFSVPGESSSTLLFRGFIQGFTDTFSSNWNNYNYVGRGETLYTYSNTNRTVGYTLQVPMFSDKEQITTYKKANTLLSYAYPKYSDTNLAQGTLLKIKVGDLLNEYAVMTNISHTINTDVPWSVGDAELMLPQVLTFRLSFNIIHRKLPERYIDHSQGSPFIANGDTEGSPFIANGDTEDVD